MPEYLPLVIRHEIPAALPKSGVQLPERVGDRAPLYGHLLRVSGWQSLEDCAVRKRNTGDSVRTRGGYWARAKPHHGKATLRARRPALRSHYTGISHRVRKEIAICE